MTKILLTRHGHVEGILPERFRGRVDLPLTESGLAQADALATRIHRDWRPIAIYASPLQRCVVTAEKIAAATGAPPQKLKELVDIDYGLWQGRTVEEVGSHAPSLLALWRSAPHLFRFPNGESLQDLFARTADALRFALAHHHDETVVFVAHDSVNRALLLQALNQPASAYWTLAQDPCAINEIEITHSHGRVLRINDSSHVPR